MTSGSIAGAALFLQPAFYSYSKTVLNTQGWQCRWGGDASCIQWCWSFQCAPAARAAQMRAPSRRMYRRISSGVPLKAMRPPSM